MKMKAIFLGLFFLPAWYLSGCQSASRVEILGPHPQGEKTVTMELSPLEARIRHLEQMLSKDGLDSDDRPVIEEFIDFYSYLRQLFLVTDPNSNNARMINGIYWKIASIEEQFLMGTQKQPGSLPQGLGQYHKTNLAIFESFLSRDYKGVIDLCLDLEKSFGSQALTPDIGLVFALSLAENNMIGEAVKVGKKVMKQLEGRPDLLLLRTKLIEWYLAEGKKDKALDIYGKLSDDLDERNALFQKAGNDLNSLSLPAKENGVKTGGEMSGVPSGAPLQIVLEEAHQLVQRQAYTEARLLLVKARIQTDDESEIQIIDQAMKEIEERQKQIEQGENPVNAFSEKEALEEATALIEEEKYEEALNTLEKVERQQQVPGTQTERLKNMAIEKIINRDRNKAAQLYLQAKQVQDPAKKKAFLQSALYILKALADKYHSSYLIERINDHISIVEKALRNL